MVQDLLLKSLLFIIALLFIIIEFISLKRRDVYQLTATASKHTLIFMLLLSFILDNININRLPEVTQGIMNNVIEGKDVIITFLAVYVILSIIYIIFRRRSPL